MEGKGMVEEQEVWENPGKGRVAIKKYDVNGRERVDLIGGGRKFSITPRERKLNQELVAVEHLDVFTNGTLRPVRLLEGDEDAKVIASNPNHLSESDMADLLKAHWKVFDERVEKINNVGTLERLLEVAQDETVGATVRAVAKLHERLSALRPSEVQETTQVGASNDALAGGIKAVTPR